MERLLCIVSSLDQGGAETFLMKVFRALPDQYKLDFVVSANTGHYESEVLKLGGRIYRIPLRTERPFKTFCDLKQIVRDNGYTNVLKISSVPIAYFDLLACKKGGAKWLAVRSCNAHSQMSIAKRSVNRILQQRFNAIADVKIAPSDLAAEYTFGAKEVDKGNVDFLNNALDFDAYKFSEYQRQKIRDEHRIDNEQFVIGHIGRFSSQKNHKFLIDIFKEILKNNSNAVLILVGIGKLQEQVKEQVRRYDIEENVKFLGARDDVAKLYSAFDVLLFPSLYEGMPNVVIEAQASGLHCVISDTITKEADITGLIDYVPLEETAQYWADRVLAYRNGYKRENTKEEFIKNGYDIQSVVDRFVELVFQEEV
ncbi:MAG: glycosyltransferase family 1 protein [Clostridia bacterium]|nr:glycosyltransferase family 1 protein [Clostridia bacterium]